MFLGEIDDFCLPPSHFPFRLEFLRVLPRLFVFIFNMLTSLRGPRQGNGYIDKEVTSDVEGSLSGRRIMTKERVSNPQGDKTTPVIVEG